MITKICANCGNEYDSLTEDEFFEKQNSYRTNQNGAYYISDIWDINIESCYACKYANLDVSKITEKEKEFMKSDKFFAIIDDDKVEDLETQYVERFNDAMVCSMIAETDENYFLASIMCYRAFEDLFDGIWEYKRELDLINRENNPQRKLETLDYLEKLDDFLLEKSYKLICKVSTDAKNIIDVMLFKAYLEYQNHKPDEMKQTLKELTDNHKLTELQLDAVDYLLQ